MAVDVETRPPHAAVDPGDVVVVDDPAFPGTTLRLVHRGRAAPSIRRGC